MPLVKLTPIYWGIDPGKNGGIVRLGPTPNAVATWKMPSSELDLYLILTHPRTTAGIESFGVVEFVSSSPQMGVTGAFTFGKGYGSILMALTARGIPFEEVRPRVWQKGLKIPPRKPHIKTKQVRIKKGKKEGQLKEVKYGGETDTEWKNRLKRKAQQLYPRVKVTLAIADALLIATYCKRKQRGTL